MAALITFKVIVDMSTGIPSKDLDDQSKAYFKEKLNLDLKTSDEACSNPKVLEHI